MGGKDVHAFRRGRDVEGKDVHAFRRGRDVEVRMYMHLGEGGMWEVRMCMHECDHIIPPHAGRLTGRSSMMNTVKNGVSG